MNTVIVLLGAPGAGKGTQAQLLAEELGYPHISSGELFREAIKAQTPLGAQAQAYLDRGELVPDDITIGMVAERLGRSDCARGVILDGFPRTVEQARALDALLSQRNTCVTLVPYIQVRDELLLQRLTGRWTCRNCQAVYHELHSPPREPGKCDLCGGELYQRADDRPETQRRRVKVYLKQTAPLIEYYRKRCVLAEIDGDGDIATVQAQLRQVLGEATGGLSSCRCGG
jgi:adenylate kinase